MIYELVQYEINPEHWDEYREWAQKRAFPLLFEHFKLKLVGFWETIPVEHDAFNSTIGVHYILAWESVEAREQRWIEMDQTDEMQTLARSARDESGNLLFHMNSRITMLEPWPGSPLQ